ncbi:MAG: ABC transporter ATP-binding protein [Bacteroidetes bacterium]|nr:ABC transporter ATP-binding protein [Bacteroidota bacterium]
MKSFREIFGFGFRYKTLAFLTILGNLSFTVFNLFSLVLFIPFLQIIFKTKAVVIQTPAPIYSGKLSDLLDFISDWYNYTMNQLAIQDPLGALFLVCILVFLAFFMKNASRYFAVWFQSEYRARIVRDIRNDLFNKVLKLPMVYHSNERKGDILTRAGHDVGEVENAVVCSLELIFRDPISIAIHVVTLLMISVELTLFSFFLLPISAFVISRIGKSLKRTAKQGQEQLGLLTSSLDESISGVRIIKSFNAVQFMSAVFRAINFRHQKLTTKTFRKKDVSSLINETIGAGVLMCLVWFGGKQILISGGQDQELTGELFITFIIVFSQLLRPINSISNGISTINKGRVSLDRINEILHCDEKIHEKSNAQSKVSLENSIEFKDVHFKYNSDSILRGINWAVKKGSSVAIVGESGSGKSTLMDLLVRFYDVSQGELLIDGIDIRDLKIYDLRQLIGIVSQESILFNVSVSENISFGDDDPDIEKIKYAAQVANAQSFIDDLENGYDTIIGERGNKLSGGQKQRLAIARAIYKNPDILILDEATSALDTESEKLVQEAVEKLMQNRTSFIIAHRLSTIINCDEIIVLSKGVISEKGTHQDLFSRKGIYYRLCRLQGLV